jgi:LCP family protein required for cell wall assembly
LRHVVYWAFLLCVAGALGGVAAFAFRPWYDALAVAEGSTGQSLPTPSKPTFTPAPTVHVARVEVAATPTATATIPPFKSPSGRVNYLILGSDNDSKKETASTPDTQVIIFVSYDTTRHQIYMVSIPRDLYVPIPGYITDKIQTAPGYANSRAEVLKAVEVNFHVTIDHYAWVGLRGFVNIINTLGGVDINVAHPMVESDFPDDIDPYASPYAVRRFFIPAGPQHLDGITALEYVRARHADLIGDFGRSERQQQVVLQVKQKLARTDLGEFPNLIQDVKGQMQTDLSPIDILSLAASVLRIDTGSIHHYYLDPIHGYVTDDPHTSAGDALIPNWTRIDALFGCIMSDKAYLGCQIS